MAYAQQSRNYYGPQQEQSRQYRQGHHERPQHSRGGSAPLRKNGGGFKRPNTIRIYTVKVSTRDGYEIYKAWELNDYKMEQHFRSADKRYFSFRDFRGKLLKNVDVKSGWRFKMALRWNPRMVSPDGKRGGWVTQQQWDEEYQRRNTYKRNHEEQENQEDVDSEYELMRIEERIANDPLGHP